jgi:hypothetical protein
MSDHISGPRAPADPIADITDVYAFPSPERPRRLVLVMNTLPFAKLSDPLSDGLLYQFRLRPLAATAPSEPAPFAAGTEEFVFDSVFSAPTGTEPFEQEGTCTTPAGGDRLVPVNDERGGSGHGVGVFAGARWDPFILDAPAALKTVATGELAFSERGSIFLDGKNVLGLVIEIDCGLLGGAALGDREGSDGRGRAPRRGAPAPRALRGRTRSARTRKPGTTGRAPRGDQHAARPRAGPRPRSCGRERRPI